MAKKVNLIFISSYRLDMAISQALIDRESSAASEIKETVHTAVKYMWYKHVPDSFKTLVLLSDSCSTPFGFWFDSERWMNMVQSSRVHSCFFKN